MCVDFDIIKDTGELIDRFSIKWLFQYDYLFFSLFRTIYNNPINTIIYCEKQIEILKEKVDEFDKLEKIKYLDFDGKKKYLISLIENTNDNEEINKLIEKIHGIICQDVDDNNYNNYNYNNNELLNKFESFKLFLEKYKNNKCDISF